LKFFSTKGNETGTGTPLSSDMERTTCDRTTELLPWLVNDSLDEADRPEVEDHLRTCADCRRALAETRGAFELFAAHPPVEAIVARAEADGVWDDTVDFEGGRIGREALDAHLAHCAECREELELARDSRRELEGEEAAPAGEGRAGAVVPFALPARPDAGAARGFDWRPLALAASLLLAVIAAGGWLFTAQEAADRQARVDELEERLAPGPAGKLEGAEPAEPPEAATVAELEERLAEIARAAEEASASAAAAERQLAGLEAVNERLREALARSPQVLQIATPVVQRGGPGAPPEVSRAAGRAVVTVFTDLAEIDLSGGRLTWRLAAGGATVAEGGPLARFRDPLGGEYVTVPLVTGDLPPGEATLTLLEDGREVADLPLRIVS